MSIYYLHHPLSYYGKKVKKLGEGTYGMVFLYERNNDEQFAIKFEEQLSPSFIREVSIVNSLQHPNVVHAIDCGITKRFQPYIVMKLAMMDGKYVYSRAHDSRKLVMYQVALGVAYLTSRGILHRDIKPANCLIRQRKSGCLNARISDYGMVHFLACGTPSSDKAYTLPYRPPEIFFGSTNYDYSADVWALGCTLYEIYTGKLLFSRLDDSSMGSLLLSFATQLGALDAREYRKITQLPGWDYDEYRSIYFDRNEKLPLIQDGDLKDLLLKMLKYNPESRISIFDVIRHPFFDEVRDHSCLSYPIPQPKSCDEIIKSIALPSPTNLYHKRIDALNFILEIMYTSDGSLSSFFLAMTLFDFVSTKMEINDGNQNMIAMICIEIASSISDQYITKKTTDILSEKRSVINQQFSKVLSVLDFNGFHSSIVSGILHKDPKYQARLNITMLYPEIQYMFLIYLHVFPYIDINDIPLLAEKILNKTISSDEAEFLLNKIPDVNNYSGRLAYINKNMKSAITLTPQEISPGSVYISLEELKYIKDFPKIEQHLTALTNIIMDINEFKDVLRVIQNEMLYTQKNLSINYQLKSWYIMYQYLIQTKPIWYGESTFKNLIQVLGKKLIEMRDKFTTSPLTAEQYPVWVRELA